MTDVCQVQQIFKLIKNKASLCPNDQIYDLCYIPLDSWNIRGVVSRICQATRFNCLPLSYTSTAQRSGKWWVKVWSAIHCSHKDNHMEYHLIAHGWTWAFLLLSMHFPDSREKYERYDAQREHSTRYDGHTAFCNRSGLISFQFMSAPGRIPNMT